MEERDTIAGSEDDLAPKRRFRGASQPKTPLSFPVPPGTCDCLTHIFGDQDRFPMAADRPYTPELASLEELQAVRRALHVDRVVVVQTTVYGTDNRCMLDGLRRLGDRARGIAVIDKTATRGELDDLDGAGVRGIRINLETVGITDGRIARARFSAAVDQLQDRPRWHIQIYTRPTVIESIADLLTQCPVSVCFDHFAGIQAATAFSEQPGLELIADLLRSGRIYVKLSAPELVSKRGPDFPDVTPLARALIDVNPERILWASHWPHPDSTRGPGHRNTDVNPLRQIDDGYVFNLLAHWTTKPGELRRILVDNPARLYDFRAGSSC
jgi:predicted TIM-barrel fold metal-dependent hydrolase